MTEGPRDLPYVILIRMLVQRYPDQVAEALRRRGGRPFVEEELDEQDSQAVLALARELLRQADPGEGLDDVEIPPGEYWMGEATDEIWGMNLGQQVLVNVHTPDKCAGCACVLHNPSDHHMRDWPLLWRGDRRIMERRCRHNIGHPDPDDLAYRRSIGRETGVHGCDGCCTRSINAPPEPMPEHGIDPREEP